MPEQKRPTYGFTIDCPLNVTYDKTTGALTIESTMSVSDTTQGFPVRVELSASAAVRILEVLQLLEKDAEMPPSAHARQSSRQ